MNKKIYIVVTIDTECDKSLNWDVQQPLSFNNILLQEKVLMPIFREYNIKPTYLLSPEVLKSTESVLYFKGIEKEVELGTHLHIEFIEPFSNMQSTTTLKVQKELNYKEEYLKLMNLTELFKKKFGYAPKSFRSGRFGSSNNTVEILSKLGYKVDSSICPFKTHYFYNGLKNNHWGRKIEPYFENYNKLKILQVPLSLVNKDYSKLPNYLLKRLETKSNFIKKALFKLGYKSKTLWLRPYRNNGDGLVSIAQEIINNHFKKEEFVVLNIMFHSNEILPSASPYCKNKKEVLEFQNSLKELFNYLNKNHNVCSIGLGELSNVYGQD